jgi:hypothetical protein
MAFEKKKEEDYNLLGVYPEDLGALSLCQKCTQFKIDTSKRFIQNDQGRMLLKKKPKKQLSCTFIRKNK